MQAAAKKEQHTPGPWSIGHTRRSSIDINLSDCVETPVHVGEGGSKGNCLAIVYIGGPGAIRNGREYTEANARLISAAPELLEACQQLLQIVRLQNGNLYADINQICDDANYAISKATGEE